MWSSVPERQQQRSAHGVVGVDGRGGVAGEVGRRILEQRPARAGDGPRVEERVGLLFGDGVAEAVAELLGGQRHRPLLVGRIAEHREAGPAAGRTAATFTPLIGRRVDGDRGDGEIVGQELLGDEPAEGVPDHDRLDVHLVDQSRVVLADGRMPTSLRASGLARVPWTVSESPGQPGAEVA